MHVSFGQGNLRVTPVIYLFDKRETVSGTKGIYAVIIFSSHPDKPHYGSFSLALTQGIQDIKNEYPDTYEMILRDRAEHIASHYFPERLGLLSTFDSCIDKKLRGKVPACCFEKNYYPSDGLDEQGIILDINNLLHFYDAFVTRNGGDWEELLALSGEASLDSEAVARQRKEQGLLREYLLGGKIVQQCMVCKHEFPKDFLVAAHIKKRAECSNDERLDFSNVAALMCKAGCDELYEKQYIFGADGVFKKNPDKVTTPQLDTIVSRVVGNCIDNWHTSHKYYQWHAAQA